MRILCFDVVVSRHAGDHVREIERALKEAEARATALGDRPMIVALGRLHRACTAAVTDAGLVGALSGGTPKPEGPQNDD